MKPTRPHPLYLLVGVLGVVFTVSACAYGVMSFKVRGGTSYGNEHDAGLMKLMREHGGKVLGVELVALTAAAVAAMASDSRAERHRQMAAKRDDDSTLPGS